MILVTAPTGYIGGHVVDALLAAGEHVRVVARHPDKLPASVRDRVEVVAGSHGDAAVIDRALDGVEALFWLVASDRTAPSVEQTFVDFSRPAAARLKAKGVARVVNITAIGHGSILAERAGPITGSLGVDALFAESGAAFRAVTCPTLMDNVLRQVTSIRERGTFSGPDIAGLCQPLCARRDVAAVAVELLRDRSWRGVGHRAVLGPHDLTYDMMAAELTAVLGKPIAYREITLDEYRQFCLAAGFSESMAQGMVDMAAAVNAGINGVEPRTPANTTPTSFRQWCEDELVPALGTSAP